MTIIIIICHGIRKIYSRPHAGEGEINSRVALCLLTRKKAAVDPPRSAPYLILVCLAKSSADSMGESIRSTVRKAARLAVYEEIMIKVKNHHMPGGGRDNVKKRLIIIAFLIGIKVKHTSYHSCRDGSLVIIARQVVRKVSGDGMRKND